MVEQFLQKQQCKLLQGPEVASTRVSYPIRGHIRVRFPYHAARGWRRGRKHSLPNSEAKSKQTPENICL